MDETEKHFIAATAGHVDHGKSSLVRALTGTDPDRLPEEKARGITLDLGFAFLKWTRDNTRFNLGWVDVPGHEDFVKNMVAGVGSIDLALLVVAADDGWMPQTEEHLEILIHLGVRQAIIAVTKIDLAPDPTACLAAIRDKLAGSPFAAAPMVGTSVVTGAGLEELKDLLGQVLATTPTPRDVGKPRLPIDRVFSLKGIGTVVTGTLAGGRLARGQEVVVQPGHRPGHIRSLQNDRRDVESSPPGARTAVSLRDIDGVPPVRGDVITVASLGEPARVFDVLLERSGRKIDSRNTPLRPVRNRSRVRLHHGTTHVLAVVHFPDGLPLERGQKKVARMKVESPVLALIGDRFLLRDAAGKGTLAGGIILDLPAVRRKATVRAAVAPDPLNVLLAQIEREGSAPATGLLRQSIFSDEEVAAAVSDLQGQGKAFIAGGLIFSRRYWDELLAGAAAKIDAGHRAQPDRAGLSLADLRDALKVSPEIFSVVVAELGRRGFSQAGVAIKRSTHRPALPAHLQPSATRIRAALSVKPFDPPSRKELAPDAVSQQALRFLIQSGEVAELGPEVVLGRESYNRIKGLIGLHLRQHGSATVSDLRQLLGSSRRIVVPLLERLDREGVTRRDGDRRLPGPSA